MFKERFFVFKGPEGNPFDDGESMFNNTEEIGASPEAAKKEITDTTRAALSNADTISGKDGGSNEGKSLDLSRTNKFTEAQNEIAAAITAANNDNEKLTALSNNRLAIKALAVSPNGTPFFTYDAQGNITGWTDMKKVSAGLYGNKQEQALSKMALIAEIIRTGKTPQQRKEEEQIAKEEATGVGKAKGLAALAGASLEKQIATERHAEKRLENAKDAARDRYFKEAKLARANGKPVAPEPDWDQYVNSLTPQQIDDLNQEYLKTAQRVVIAPPEEQSQEAELKSALASDF